MVRSGVKIWHSEVGLEEIVGYETEMEEREDLIK